MMFRASILLAVLFVWGVITAATQESHYDKFRDQTTVTVKGLEVSGLSIRGEKLYSSSAYLAFQYTFSGRKLRTPAKYVRMYVALFGSDMRFDPNNVLIALLDGERVKLPTLKRLYFEPRGDAGLVLLPTELFLRITKSTVVEMLAGVYEFTVTESAMMALERYSEPLRHLKTKPSKRAKRQEFKP